MQKPGDDRRSPEWPRVRAEYLARHPTCAGCGCTEEEARARGGSLEAHHMQPFHLFPALELDPSNLIPLCEHPDKLSIDVNHHFHLGHNGTSWSDYNKNVISDAAANLAKVKGQP